MLPTRSTPLDEAELLDLPLEGTTVVLHDRDREDGTLVIDVQRGASEVGVVLSPVEDWEVEWLGEEAAAAVRAANVPGAAVLLEGDHLELARDVAVALAKILRGVVHDGEGVLGQPGTCWPAEEAAVRPVRPRQERVRGRVRTTVAVVPRRPQGGFVCWGDLTRRLPASLAVRPGPGGMPVGRDDVLLGVAWIYRDHARVAVEVRDPVHLGLLLTDDQRRDRAWVGPVHRALGHGAPLIEVSWHPDVPGEEAIAWGLIALVMERWDGVAVVSPYLGHREGQSVPERLPATPEEAWAESRRCDPTLDWTPAPPLPPPRVRWASVGGVDFDARAVVPRYEFPGEPPPPVFVGRMRVFPARHVLFRSEELATALDLEVSRERVFGEADDGVPWTVVLARGENGVLLVQPLFPSTPEELDHASFDEATRARVEQLLRSAHPLGRGPGVLELHVDAIDPVDVAIAREVAAFLAERTDGVVAADHPLLLEPAGRTFTARQVRAFGAVGA